MYIDNLQQNETITKKIHNWVMDENELKQSTRVSISTLNTGQEVKKEAHTNLASSPRYVQIAVEKKSLLLSIAIDRSGCWQLPLH
jgi:hypothetical protein